MDCFIAPLTAFEQIKEHRAHMTPEQVREMMLLATGSQESAEREWRRQVDYLMQQEKP